MRALLVTLAALAGLVAPALAADCQSSALATSTDSETCTCPAGMANGWVYGTDRYTADSAPCAAAIHAGKITEAGGEITYFMGEGCGAFKGSAANGVSSSDWGAYDRSFGFASPLPACAAAAEAGPVVEATPAPEPTPAPTPGPGAADGEKEWKARAALYAAALPEALTGWTATPRDATFENSSVTDRRVTGSRIYKKDETSQNELVISIVNAPDASPYPIYERMWTDAAFQAETQSTKSTIGGREALTSLRWGDTMILFRTEAGVFVAVKWLGSHTTTQADADGYIGTLDFAKIDKLPMR